jgi:hypothetical protein
VLDGLEAELTQALEEAVDFVLNRLARRVNVPRILDIAVLKLALEIVEELPLDVLLNGLDELGGKLLNLPPCEPSPPECLLVSR